MRLLNGAELAGFIKERQVRQVRSLRQAHHVVPRLAVVLTNDHPASVKYVQMKQRYGADIGVEVVVEHVLLDEAVTIIKKHNADAATHGIIVQLPLDDPARTDEVLAAIDPRKDVDALHSTQFFDPATPVAILWLLAGYNTELRGKKVVVIGQGRLVGAPLVKLLRASNINPVVVDKGDDVAAACADAEVVISGTGQPRLLTSKLIPHGAVVVDAGTASEGGKLAGDVDPEVLRSRDDLTITPQKGGVGPLTVCALFENVLRAARSIKNQNS